MAGYWAAQLAEHLEDSTAGRLVGSKAEWRAGRSVESSVDCSAGWRAVLREVTKAEHLADY